MASLERLIEGWAGECVVVRYDAPSGSWIFIAIHDRTLGMAMGGCRMRVYPGPADGLLDAMRLAEGMTLKWAGLEFPLGGGKAVLAVPRPLDGAERHGLLLRFGDLVEGLGGLYATGVDLGTTPADMNVVGRRTDRVAGRLPEAGGAGDPGPWTALGVYEGMRAAAAHLFGQPDLAGRRVLVQGVGGVGRPLALRLREAGAEVVIADASEERSCAVAAELGVDRVPVDAVYGTECDIFAPCAIGAVLNAGTVPSLRCRIVAGSANNQLEEDADADRLADRGILYLPDFVVNAGGAVAHGILEILGGVEADVEPLVRRIGPTITGVLEESESRGETPLAAAVRRARRHISERRGHAVAPE
jgi:leucine dehydrogenase